MAGYVVLLKFLLDFFKAWFSAWTRPLFSFSLYMSADFFETPAVLVGRRRVRREVGGNGRNDVSLNSFPLSTHCKPLPRTLKVRNLDGGCEGSNLGSRRTTDAEKTGTICRRQV